MSHYIVLKITYWSNTV